MTHFRATRWMVAAGVAALLLAASAQAADPPAKPKGKVLKLDEISVEGKIQKPQAFYILPRSNLNYSALDQQDSLLPKIKRVTQAEPF